MKWCIHSNEGRRCCNRAGAGSRRCAEVVAFEFSNKAELARRVHARCAECRDGGNESGSIQMTPEQLVELDALLAERME